MVRQAKREATSVLDAERLHRKKMAAVNYPLPIKQHALAFSGSELGETQDAHLRTHPLYRRNNGRQVSMEVEIGDTLGMLATAIIAPLSELPEEESDLIASIGETMIYLGTAMVHAASRMESADDAAYNADAAARNAIEILCIMCRRAGIDPLEAHAMSRRKQEAKWLK